MGRLLAAVGCLLLLAGCAGTMVTRTDKSMRQAPTQPHEACGGYPFQAVVVDFQLELRSADERERQEGAGHPLEPILSLFVDLAVDLVLAPIDLVAWPFGCHKRALIPSP